MPLVCELNCPVNTNIVIFPALVYKPAIEPPGRACRGGFECKVEFGSSPYFAINTSIPGSGTSQIDGSRTDFL